MLCSVRDHQSFVQFIVPRLKTLFLVNPYLFKQFSLLVLKVSLLDLDSARNLIAPCYSSSGRPNIYDPLDLLRSLIIMVSLQITSISKWVERLQNEPVLAILSGFVPGQTPSVGTFYDFWDRLWLQDQELRRLQKKKPKKKHKRPKHKKKNEKLPNKHPGVVAKLVDSFLKGKFFSNNRPELLLQKIFLCVFVQTSCDKGLVDNFMDIAGDGSPFWSAANFYGRPICDCRKHGIRQCDCHRIYSDPYANWGYDSYRKVFFFGRNLYTISCVNGPAELPIYLRFGQGCRHDSILGVFSLVELDLLLKDTGLSIKTFIGDSAHDNYATYRLCEHLQILPVIDLRIDPAKASFSLNSAGIPICPNGNLMAYYGYDPNRSRFKWRCPKHAGKKKYRQQAKCDRPCSESAYGRVVYNKTEQDPRLFPRIPRGSKQYRELYNKRTAAERINKRYNDFGLDLTRVRDNCFWYHLAHLAAMNIHLDAWVRLALKESGLSHEELACKFLGFHEDLAA